MSEGQGFYIFYEREQTFISLHIDRKEFGGGMTEGVLKALIYESLNKQVQCFAYKGKNPRLN